MKTSFVRQKDLMSPTMRQIMSTLSILSDVLNMHYLVYIRIMSINKFVYRRDIFNYHVYLTRVRGIYLIKLLNVAHYQLNHLDITQGLLLIFLSIDKYLRLLRIIVYFVSVFGHFPFSHSLYTQYMLKKHVYWPT